MILFANGNKGILFLSSLYKEVREYIIFITKIVREKVFITPKN